MENVGPPSGFTVAINPMYDLPLNYAPQKVPTQPQSVHISISNEAHMVERNPIVHNDEGNPQFTRNMPNSQGAHLVTKMERSQVAEVVGIGCDLEKWLRVMEGFNTLRLDKISIDVFMDTLQSPHFKRMVGIMSSSFFDPVMLGECIESNLNSKKI